MCHVNLSVCTSTVSHLSIDSTWRQAAGGRRHRRQTDESGRNSKVPKIQIQNPDTISATAATAHHRHPYRPYDTSTMASAGPHPGMGPVMVLSKFIDRIDALGFRTVIGLGWLGCVTSTSGFEFVDDVGGQHWWWCWCCCHYRAGEEFHCSFSCHLQLAIVYFLI